MTYNLYKMALYSDVIRHQSSCPHCPGHPAEVAQPGRCRCAAWLGFGDGDGMVVAVSPKNKKGTFLGVGVGLVSWLQ